MPEENDACISRLHDETRAREALYLDMPHEALAILAATATTVLAEHDLQDEWRRLMKRERSLTALELLGG